MLHSNSLIISPKIKAGSNYMPKHAKNKKTKENEAEELLELNFWFETRPQGP